jgi:hypothetical protein
MQDADALLDKPPVRVIVVGLGVQGAKRKRFAGADFVASVDPVNADADFRTLQDVPRDRYDAALCCIPDAPKIELLTYLAQHGKHALVEALWAADDAAISGLEALACNGGVVICTAYNHRFEPHYVAMRDLVAGSGLGQLYHLPHVLQQRHDPAGARQCLARPARACCTTWARTSSTRPASGLNLRRLRVVFSSTTRTVLDHVVVASNKARPKLELEMTLLNWRSMPATCSPGRQRASPRCASGSRPASPCAARAPPGARRGDGDAGADDPTWEAEYAHEPWWRGRADGRNRPVAQPGCGSWVNRAEGEPMSAADTRASAVRP